MNCPKPVTVARRMRYVGCHGLHPRAKGWAPPFPDHLYGLAQDEMRSHGWKRVQVLLGFSGGIGGQIPSVFYLLSGMLHDL